MAVFVYSVYEKVRMRVFKQLRHYIPRAQFHDNNIILRRPDPLPFREGVATPDYTWHGRE